MGANSQGHLPTLPIVGSCASGFASLLSPFGDLTGYGPAAPNRDSICPVRHCADVRPVPDLAWPALAWKPAQHKSPPARPTNPADWGRQRLALYRLQSRRTMLSAPRTRGPAVFAVASGSPQSFPVPAAPADDRSLPLLRCGPGLLPVPRAGGLSRNTWRQSLVPAHPQDR